MVPVNCWEYKKCGRDSAIPGPDKPGTCPALVYTPAHGLNSGTNGGRICWSVAGSFCHGEAKGENARERFSCMTCDFYTLVEQEEGIDSFTMVMPGQLNQFMTGKEQIMFTVDKRTHKRTAAILEVQYFHDGSLYYGIATDISETGMCIRHGVSLPRRSSGKLIIHSRPSSVIVPFQVQWMERTDNIYNNSMGVEFLRPQPHYKEFIENQVPGPDIQTSTH